MLEDCFGIPKCDELILKNNNIKSFKGLPSKLRAFELSGSLVENLKYSPIVAYGERYVVFDCPLLSVYDPTGSYYDKRFYNNTLVQKAYTKRLKLGSTSKLDVDPTDTELNAEIFTYFNNSFYTKRIPVNPWINIYEDPNEVENYDFLFLPFYFSSENFRGKAKDYIKNLDMGTLNRSDLW